MTRLRASDVSSLWFLAEILVSPSETNQKYIDQILPKLEPQAREIADEMLGIDTSNIHAKNAGQSLIECAEQQTLKFCKICGRNMKFGAGVNMCKCKPQKKMK